MIATDTATSRFALWIACLVLASFFIFCLWVHVEGIESDLESQSVGALSTAGIDNMELTLSGRDVRLVGTVASEEQRVAVGQRLLAIKGVRAVDNQLTLARGAAAVAADKAALYLPNLNFTFTAGQISITGLVADQQTRDAVIKAATLVATGRRVLSDITVSNDVSQVQGLPRLTRLIKVFDIKQPGMIDLKGRVLTLRGSLSSEGLRQQLLDQASAMLGQDVSIEDKLQVVESTPFPTVADKAAVQQESEASPALRLQSLDLTEVTFKSGSDVLTSSGKSALGTAIGLLNQFPHLDVEVAGHTDALGDEAFNFDLSQRRAQSVVDYLVASGVKRGRLVARGYGEYQPVAVNNTAEGRARNRRIEFHVMGGSD